MTAKQQSSVGSKWKLLYFICSMFFFFNIVFVANFAASAAEFRFTVFRHVVNAVKDGKFKEHDAFEYAGRFRFFRIPLPDYIEEKVGREAFAVVPLDDSDAKAALFTMDEKGVYVAKTQQDFVTKKVDEMFWGRAKVNLWWAGFLALVSVYALIPAKLFSVTASEEEKKKHKLTKLGIAAMVVCRFALVLGAMLFPLAGISLTTDMRVFNFFAGVIFLLLSLTDYMKATGELPLLK